MQRAAEYVHPIAADTADTLPKLQAGLGGARRGHRDHQVQIYDGSGPTSYN
jgi:hypothetical protein